jgi:hypothetical protein
MSGFEITCVNKNARGNIVSVGGDGWNLVIYEAIRKTVSQQLRLNIQVEGRSVAVGVRGDGMDAYLALEPDGFPLHQLTNLPSC